MSSHCFKAVNATESSSAQSSGTTQVLQFNAASTQAVAGVGGRTCPSRTIAFSQTSSFRAHAI
ncbi:MAG: hypothetical protein KME13_21275, partial [Myxacorys californica WJT36-NPBG1]|nr:hypothetical protein [Myxacorys californica WJT36-NPBG1]